MNDFMLELKLADEGRGQDVVMVIRLCQILNYLLSSRDAPTRADIQAIFAYSHHSYTILKITFRFLKRRCQYAFQCDL